MLRRPPRLLLAAFAFLLLAFACAEQPYFLAVDAPPVESIQTLVVLPVNFDVGSPRLWTGGLERTGVLVVDSLQSTGHEVEAIDYGHALEIWQRAVAAVGGLESGAGQLDPERLEAARGQLAATLLDGSGAQALVITNVVAGLAKADGGRNVSWDGVTRRVQIETSGAKSQYWRLNGNYRVSSLRIAFFDRDGDLFYEKTQGLELLESLYIDGNENVFQEIERTDLFRDEDLLRTTVRRVLSPLFDFG